MNGVLLIAVGNDLYAKMAAVCAASIKKGSPDIRVAIIHTEKILDSLSPGQRDLFDIKISCGSPNDVEASIMDMKTRLCDLTPFENTLYLDSDTIVCPGKTINSLFRELDSVDFTIQNDGFFDHKEKASYPAWGDPDKIKKIYHIENFVISNSSLIWFKKGPVSKKAFRSANAILNDEREFGLWRGVKPDELCFNVAMAQLNITPHKTPFEPVYVYFKNCQRSKEYVVDNYTLMTTIGTRVTDARVIQMYDDFMEYYFDWFGFNLRYRYREKEVSVFCPPVKRSIPNPKIGIGVTTCGRNVLDQCIANISQFSKPGYKLYVNDDSVFKEGIAAAKNNCLRELDDCDYIFLFDDDCYPIKHGWEDLFIEASNRTGNQHFCLTFDTLHDGGKNGNSFLRSVDGIDEFSNPCGIMLFFTKDCIRLVGGMDCRYKVWGGEHSGFSSRIFNSGLTKSRFACPSGAMNYFYSLDQHNAIAGTISNEMKLKLDKFNSSVHGEECSSIGFKPYKPGNFICSIYLTGAKKNYGNFTGRKDVGHIKKWAASLVGTSFTGIMFHNCFTPQDILSMSEYPVKFIKVNPPIGFMSGLYRFELYDKFIKKYRKYILNIFLTDSTDLDMLRDPTRSSNYSDRVVYVGCESSTRGCEWMMNHCQGYDKYLNLVKSDDNFKNGTLLNAGLIGGYVSNVSAFVSSVARECKSVYDIADVQDMAIVNYVSYAEIGHRILSGPIVNTEFKKYEQNNNAAWFRHK